MEATSLTFNRIINPSSRTHQTKIPAAPPPRLTLKRGEGPTGMLKAGKDRRLALAGCVAQSSGGSAAVVGIITPEEEEELTQRREKCRETSSVVELLECLETEAVTGENEGRDPEDYSRRAKIFEKSSRIFQAIKEQRNCDDREGEAQQ